MNEVEMLALGDALAGRLRSCAPVSNRRQGPALDVLTGRDPADLLELAAPIECLLRTRWDRLLDHEPAAAQDTSRRGGAGTGRSRTFL